MSFLYALLIIVAAILVIYLLCRLGGIDEQTRNILYALAIIAGIIWLLKIGVF